MLTTNECQDIVIQCDHCEKHVDFTNRASFNHVRNHMRSWHGFQIAQIDGPAICPDCQKTMVRTELVHWRITFDGGKGGYGFDAFAEAVTPEEAISLGRAFALERADNPRPEDLKPETIRKLAAGAGVLASNQLGYWRRFDKNGKFEKLG